MCIRDRMNVEHEDRQSLLRNCLSSEEREYLTEPYIDAQELNRTLLLDFEKRSKQLQTTYNDLSKNLIRQYALNFSRSRDHQLKRLNKLNEAWLRKRFESEKNSPKRRLSRNERASKQLQGIEVEKDEEEDELKAKNTEEYNRDIQLISQLQSLLKSNSHLYGRMIQDFVASFIKEFRIQPSDDIPSQQTKERLFDDRTEEIEDLYSIVLPPDSKLAIAIKNVQSTTERMHGTLVTRYEGELGTGMYDERKVRFCCASALENVLMPQIYPVLFDLYTTQYQEQDVRFNSQCERLNELITSPSCLSIPRQFCLEGIYAYYDAITTFRRLPLFQTATLKIECLVQTSKCIFQSIKDYWASKSNYKPIMGADELLPLFTYVIIKSLVVNLHSESSFMSDFVPEEMMMGQEGYCLATFQAALQHIYQMDEHELSLEKQTIDEDTVVEEEKINAQES
eukprot:TRINITY_DN3703_c0_g1_i1.p1 TRINITY_DN3703_c0_g1~~TRINITY_DN3703_c0_g1_i1.p1  ORF type:complete len:452 (+),score=113.66 TRINITY_DN3703_c0_g1_i1:37-1392(+)